MPRMKEPTKPFIAEWCMHISFVWICGDWIQVQSARKQHTIRGVCVGEFHVVRVFSWFTSPIVNRKFMRKYLRAKALSQFSYFT